MGSGEENVRPGRGDLPKIQLTAFYICENILVEKALLGVPERRPRERVVAPTFIYNLEK